MSIDSWPPRWLTPVPESALLAGEGELVADFSEAFGIITKDSVAGRAGSPMVLRPWQKELLRHLYASDEAGGLKHRINLVGVPRKNGKSALGSLMTLTSLVLGARGGETYSIAAEKEQARIVFADTKRIIEHSPELSALMKVYRDVIEMPATGSIYRVLSAEAYSKEGLNPTFVLFDELHAQPSRELFDVMSLAGGSRGNLFQLTAITTAGVKTDTTGRDSVAYSLYQYGQKVARGEIDDPSFFMAWWENDGDYRDPETWRAANPGFDDINARSDFESAVRRTPEAEFRIKRCNQWVSSQISWLPTGSWNECANDFEVSADEEIILGFDGSFSGDASVIVGATIPKGEEASKIFLVRAWEKDEQVDDPDWRVDIADVEQTIIDFCATHPKVREIACDPFRWQHSMQVLENLGLPIVEYPSTNARRMVTSCAKFYDAVMEKRLVHDGNPVLERHLDNCVTKIDALGPRIVKETRHSVRRIDAAVAAVIAYDRATVGRLEEIVPQFFG